MKNPKMRPSLCSIFLGSLCGLLLTIPSAHGAVTLSLTDTVDAPNSVEVNLNNPASRFFTFTLTLNATTESTTGSPIFWKHPTSPATGIFES